MPTGTIYELLLLGSGNKIIGRLTFETNAARNAEINKLKTPGASFVEVGNTLYNAALIQAMQKNDKEPEA